MLQLLLERQAPAEQLDGAVRALVAQQCRCGWPTSDDTASAVTALSAYAATEKFVPGTATRKRRRKKRSAPLRSARPHHRKRLPRRRLRLPGSALRIHRRR